MTYKYFLICSQQIEEDNPAALGFEPTDSGVWGQRSTSYTKADGRFNTIGFMNFKG